MSEFSLSILTLIVLGVCILIVVTIGEVIVRAFIEGLRALFGRGR